MNVFDVLIELNLHAEIEKSPINDGINCRLAVVVVLRASQQC